MLHEDSCKLVFENLVDSGEVRKSQNPWCFLAITAEILEQIPSDDNVERSALLSDSRS